MRTHDSSMLNTNGQNLLIAKRIAKAVYEMEAPDRSTKTVDASTSRAVSSRAQRAKRARTLKAERSRSKIFDFRDHENLRFSDDEANGVERPGAFDIPTPKSSVVHYVSPVSMSDGWAVFGPLVTGLKIGFSWPSIPGERLIGVVSWGGIPLQPGHFAALTARVREDRDVVVRPGRRAG